MEYIITVYSPLLKKYCLECPVGTDLTRAKRILAEKATEYPEKSFKIETIETKEAWWWD